MKQADGTTINNADVTPLTVGTNAVMRPRTNLADPTDAAGITAVKNATPAATTYGVVTRPFTATDGSNVAPTMDAAARPGFVKVTDGTNTMPTMDAAARAGYVTVTDLGAHTDAAVTDATNVTTGATLLAFIKGLAKIFADVWDSVNHRLQVAVAASEVHLGEIGGNLAVVVGTFARPANTTAYAAGTVVNGATTSGTNALAFTVARKASGSGYITKARLTTDLKTCTARFRVWLYAANPTAINADGGVKKLQLANRAVRIGSFDFVAMATEDATTSDCAEVTNADLRIAFTADATQKIYVVLETLDVFTPASGQNFWLELSADLN